MRQTPLRAGVCVLLLGTDVTERVLEAFRRHAILPPAVLHRSVGDPVAPVREVA